jgi:hypothetical protein
MKSTLSRVSAPAIVLFATIAAARAQQPPQPQGAPPQNPVCSRLEAQLQAFDRGSSDATRAEQVRRFEEAAANQQAEIDRQEATAQRMGCGGNSFFVLFSGNQAQCSPINAKIQQMRNNLDRIQNDLERLRGGTGPEREKQRRAILVALSQNNCGAQYQAQVAAAPPSSGGFLDSLFGARSIFTPGNDPAFSAPNGTYRTVCVRTCDGYYFPISYATTPARFAEDERTCRQSCPAADVSLYSYPNPGGDMNQAISVSTQQPYTSLANAFRYRQSLDPTCSCRHPGESWSQALKNIDHSTVEQGDIVVNEQRAKAMSQPRVDAQGRLLKPDARATAKPAASAAPVTPAPDTAASNEPPDKPDPNRNVRTVGPTFISPGR